MGSSIAHPRLRVISGLPIIPAVLFLLIAATASKAGDRTNVRWLDVEFPKDSPIAVVSFGLGESTATVRGSSLALDLHTSLSLRNSSTRSIRGLTLRVEAQDLTPGGKASVTVPSVNVKPGEVFPVRLDLELLRPFHPQKNSRAALVQVSLDGVLFDDLSFYGPDKLHSRRSLTVYELEARRDRHYYSRMLAKGKVAALRSELNFGLTDMNPQSLGFEVLKDAITGQRKEPSAAVTFVSFPSSPIQALGGEIFIIGNEARAAQLEIRNRSKRPVRSLEVGWIVRDEKGQQYLAGSRTMSVELAPNKTTKISDSCVLRVSRSSGGPLVIGAVTSFINNVEFVDGKMWIPSRSDLTKASADGTMKRELSTSPEQQRLTEIYRKKGMTALVSELKKFN